MVSIRDLISKRGAITSTSVATNKTNNKPDKVIEQIPAIEKEKITKFENNLVTLLSNKLEDIYNFFKARPKDVVFLGYDKDLQNFAVSVDEKTWIKLTRRELKFTGYIPVPERGTIWRSRNSKALFIVLEFVNCRGLLADDEFPSILYMGETGINRVCKITDWHGKFIFCNHTVGKD